MFAKHHLIPVATRNFGALIIDEITKYRTGGLFLEVLHNVQSHLFPTRIEPKMVSIVFYSIECSNYADEKKVDQHFTH